MGLQLDQIHKQEIFYRQLLRSDYAEYRRVRLGCLKQYPDNFGNTYEEELKANSLRLSGAIHASDHCNFAFGAFDEKQLIGLCGFVTVNRLKTKHRGEIVQVFVDKAYAGLGVGKKLLQLTIDKAFNNGQTEQIILSVVATNEKAIGLYENLGFKEYGRLENYFKSGNRRYCTQTFLVLSKKVEDYKI